MTYSFLVYDKSVFWVAVFYNHISPFTLLPGPLLFWYTRNTIQGKQGLKKIDYLHFIPTIIQLIGIASYSIKPFTYKLDVATKIVANLNYANHVATNIFFTTYENFIIRFSTFLIYIVISLTLIGKYYFSSDKSFNPSSIKSIKWLLILNISPLIIVFNSLIFTYNCIVNEPSVGIVKSHFLLLISEFLFLIMSFSLLLFPNVLYGLTPTIVKPKKKKDKMPLVIKENIRKEGETKPAIMGKIDAYLNEKKPYLNPDFSVNDISLDLKIPVNKITQIFNTYYGKKFSDVKKELRVKHSIGLLENNLSEFITMDAIGQKSGFTTRSNFYIAFKSITNTTPSEYLKNLESKMDIENNT